LRYSTSSVGGDFYRLSVNAKGGDLSLSTVNLGKTTFLRHWHLPRAYGPDEWLRLEMRAIGDELTVIADGQTLGTIHDTSQPGVGGVMLYATANGYFRDAVYVPLERASAAEPWQDMLHGAMKLVLSAGADRTSEGLRLSGDGSAMYYRVKGKQHDGALRIRGTFGDVHPHLRVRALGAGGTYGLGFRDPKTVVLDLWDNVARRGITLRISAARAVGVGPGIRTGIARGGRHFYGEAQR